MAEIQQIIIPKNLSHTVLMQASCSKFLSFACGNPCYLIPNCYRKRLNQILTKINLVSQQCEDIKTAVRVNDFVKFFL